MSRILEIEKEKPFTNVIKPQEEENKENNINTNVDIETSVEMPKNSEIDNTDIILINQDKKNPLVELINYLIKLLKSIFNKG